MHEVEAVVVDILPRSDGQGKYAVAKPLEGIVTEPPIDGTVIFFLNKKVWDGEIQARKRMKVILRGIFETVDGWQADKARPKQLQVISGPEEQKQAAFCRRG